MADPTRLYHYTCRDSAARIRETGQLRPLAQHQLDGRRLIWLTDLAVATRAQLCLTSHTLACDRMEYRVTVVAHAVHWPRYVRVGFLSARTRRLAQDLGLAPGALPMHWWVSELLIPVLSVEPVGGLEARR